MLTAQLVRVRFARDRIIARYVDPHDAELLAVAGTLIATFRTAGGRTRGELTAEFDDLAGGSESQFIHRGLVKLLEDRCEFEVVAGQPPETIRAEVFGRAAAARRSPLARLGGGADGGEGPSFDRASVLARAAVALGLSETEVESGLFADLKSEQRLVRFDDVSPERLLRRYNLALAQGILLKAVRVTIDLHHEPPARFRALLRRIKFHRLSWTANQLPSGESPGANCRTEARCRLVLDGPLSLFTATQRYGVQLASFLPAITPCRQFELNADLLWGLDRRPKIFTLTQDDGLTTDAPDPAGNLPTELAMFAEQFRKKVMDWRLIEESAVLPLGDSFWVPDFRLEHAATGRSVYLEILGYWRRSSAEQHLARLRAHAPAPFVLAVSDQLRLDDSDLADLPAEVLRFRQMPLPDEIAGRAALLVERI